MTIEQMIALMGQVSDRLAREGLTTLNQREDAPDWQAAEVLEKKSDLSFEQARAVSFASMILRNLAPGVADAAVCRALPLRELARN